MSGCSLRAAQLLGLLLNAHTCGPEAQRERREGLQGYLHPEGREHSPRQQTRFICPRPCELSGGSSST